MKHKLLVKFSCIFLLTLGGVLLNGYVNYAEAASPVWTWMSAAGKGNNDVAIDSHGTIYVTRKDGSVYYLLNGVYTSIPIPQPIPISTRTTSSTETTSETYKATRITIDPEDDMPWVIFIKHEVRTYRNNRKGITIVKLDTSYNVLFHLQVSNHEWIERENAHDPADVAVGTNGIIFITCAHAPYGVFSTDISNLPVAFTSVPGTNGSSRISVEGRDKLWLVKRDGSVWQKSGNSPFVWIKKMVEMIDVGASRSGTVLGFVERYQQNVGRFLPPPTLTGTLWRWNNTHNTFIKDLKENYFFKCSRQFAYSLCG